ncbi:MAG: hypothetical protein GY927_09830 [bacterium]|nr:hypothetical protein [bacterium]
MSSPAIARNAKCLITSGNSTQFRRVCDFQAEPNGSFSLTNTKKSGRFFGDTVVVSVTVLSKNRADIRGLTKSGINSRWGSVKRSRKDRACWVGSDFKICAW